jgi:hypothetical protein
VRRGVEPRNGFRGDLEPLRLATADLHRLQVQRLDRIAIGDITRPRERHPLARRKQRGQRQHEGGRSAAGQDHLLGLDRDAVRLGIMARDPLLERNALPIAHAVGVEHLMRFGDSGCRRAGGRLAELHMDHRSPLGGHTVRGAADGDGVERIDGSGHGARLASLAVGRNPSLTPQHPTHLDTAASARVALG